MSIGRRALFDQMRRHHQSAAIYKRLQPSPSSRLAEGMSAGWWTLRRELRRFGLPDLPTRCGVRKLAKR
jgi:hypothetical protein